MAYEIELIKKEECQTNLWAGGTTTQLAIYPKDAIYSERNFKWRLSSAHVEVEESVFTSLPHINRIIMIIEGEIALEHEGHHRCVLKKFDQDRFSGSWKTRSFGRVTDFNLMMSEDCEGELDAIHLDKGQLKKVFLDNKKGFLENVQAIYCVNGQIILKTTNGDEILGNEGDIILIKTNNNLRGQYFEVYNKKAEKADLIRVDIFF